MAVWNTDLNQFPLWVIGIYHRSEPINSIRSVMSALRPVKRLDTVVHKACLPVNSYFDFHRLVFFQGRYVDANLIHNTELVWCKLKVHITKSVATSGIREATLLSF